MVGCSRVNFHCRDALLIWIIVEQGYTALAVGADHPMGLFGHFSLSSIFFFLSPSLWETA